MSLFRTQKMLHVHFPTFRITIISYTTSDLVPGLLRPDGPPTPTWYTEEPFYVMSCWGGNLI